MSKVLTESQVDIDAPDWSVNHWQHKDTCHRGAATPKSIQVLTQAHTHRFKVKNQSFSCALLQLAFQKELHGLRRLEAETDEVDKCNVSSQGRKEKHQECVLWKPREANVYSSQSGHSDTCFFFVFFFTFDDILVQRSSAQLWMNCQWKKKRAFQTKP